MSALPQIFDEDVNALISRLQTRLQTALGRSFAPSDVEMLLINSFCYELYLFNIKGNQAFRQNLVSFSSGAMLDYLGELVGVDRLPASPAVCTLQFTLVPGHSTVLLPAGTRVESLDGSVIFQTDNDVQIPLTTNTVNVTATCQTNGIAGNGFDPGKITLLLDPQAYVTSVQNIDTTNSGSDDETDDELRERIKLAPASFSVAGPRDAYIYWAKTASPTIADVKCVTTNPGEVTLYPLCLGGLLASAELKQQILLICSADNIRPQNDTVLVSDPDVISYAIDIQVTTFTGAIDSDVLSQVNSNLQAFVNTNLNKLGVDIIRAKLNSLCVIDGKVYNINVVSPANDIIVNDNQYANCTGINVAIIGSNGG